MRLNTRTAASVLMMVSMVAMVVVNASGPLPSLPTRPPPRRPSSTSSLSSSSGSSSGHHHPTTTTTTALVPTTPQHAPARWEFAIQALYYPSFRLATKFFRRVLLAQSAYALAAISIGETHAQATRAFTQYHQQALVYARGVHQWHRVDPDPVRRAWMTVRVEIMDGEVKLLESQARHLPPPNVVVKGVVRVAKVTKEALVEVGRTVAKAAVGVAYAAVSVVAGVIYLVYRGLELAYDAVQYLARKVAKGVKYLHRNWFPIHHFHDDEMSNKLLYKRLEKRVLEEYGGDWDLAFLADAAAFSCQQSTHMNANMGQELEHAYMVLPEEERRRVELASGLTTGVVPVDWTHAVETVDREAGPVDVIEHVHVVPIGPGGHFGGPVGPGVGGHFGGPTGHL